MLAKMTKKELRNYYKQLRSALSEQEREAMSKKIVDNLQQLPIWKYSTYHIFLPIEKLHEINTHHLIAALKEQHKTIVVPVMHPESKSLTSVLLTSDSKLQTNTWGVPEPNEEVIIPDEKIDVVFVPLLAYDSTGNRIGYGGGYYDRFLAQCKPTTLKIGLSFFPPHPDSFAAITHNGDIVLDSAVSPLAVSNFKN